MAAKIIPATIPVDKQNAIKQRLNNQLKVADNVSKIRQEQYQNDKYKITPIQDHYKTADEELNDQTHQIQIALTNLKQILPKALDAQAALTNLVNSNDIADFNRFFIKFQNDIKGISSITPNFFDELWKKFKDKLNETDRTTIVLPSQSATDLSEVHDKIEDLINAIDENLPNISEYDVETIKNTIEAISQTNRINSDRLSQIFEHLIKSAETKDLSKFMETFASVFKEKKLGQKIKDINDEINKKKNEVEQKAAEVEKQRKKAEEAIDKNLEKAKAEQTKSKEQKEIQKGAEKKEAEQAMEDEYQELQKMSDDNVWKKFEKAYDKNRISSYVVNGKRFNIPKSPNQRPNREKMTKNNMIDYIMYHKYVKPHNFDYPISGKGFRFRLRGKGFLNEIKTSEPNFGQYRISEKHLSKGHICLRYPSGNKVKQYPDIIVSPDFQKIICDIIYDKKFDKNDYKLLEDSEKRLFNEIIRISKANIDSNLQLYKLKTLTDKEQNEDIKKFKILSGEVIAGNDNPDIIKDLKKLTIKLYNEGFIRRSDYNRVLEAIFALT